MIMEDKNKIIIEVGEEEFDAEKAPKKTVRVLSFRLSGELYCMNITHAKEVFKPISVTRVPNVPPFVVGVVNLHGEVIPVIDIRYFLGLQQKEGLGGTKVIVTDVRSNPIGVLVDEIGEAVDIEEGSIQPPLATIKGSLADFTKGQVQLEKDIIIILDLKKVLSCDEIEKLKKGQ